MPCPPISWKTSLGYTSYKAKNVAFWGLAQLHPGVAGGDVLLVLLLIVFL